MNLERLHFLAVVEGKKIEFKVSNEISLYCPHCKEHLIKYTLNNNITECQHEQEYLYLDGDTVNYPEKHFNKLDSAMVFGKCEKCGHQIVCIEANILDKDIHGYIKRDEEDKPCLVVVDSDNLVISFDVIEQYEVKIDNIVIGHMLFYKNANLNKDALYNIGENNIRNICRFDLECLSENSNMQCSDLGICNGHYESCEQMSVWDMASDILSRLYDATSIFIEENIN